MQDGSGRATAHAPARQVAPSALAPPEPTACSRQVIPAGAPLAETCRTLPQAVGETFTEAETLVVGSLPESAPSASPTPDGSLPSFSGYEVLERVGCGGMRGATARTKFVTLVKFSCTSAS